MTNKTNTLEEPDFDDPKVIEERNNRKLTADKIRQILSKVENNPGDSSKRWVWELIQNAKDVPNRAFGRVSIQITLTKDELTFKHNGDPFSLNNIFSLIQQVSSKDSTNTDEDVTGKFGTGFISTHLLSKKILVEGIVKHRGVHRKFKTLLDRSGNNSEEMLPKIDKALNRIRNIENDILFPIVNDYETSRTEDSLDTVFTYFLDSEERITFAKDGIKDLVNTLPLTLVYLPKIKGVSILNEFENQDISYISELKVQKNQISKFTVSIYKDSSFEREHNFITYSTSEVSLAIEVRELDNLELIPNNPKNPKLFRDFPLIGSQKFHFPFILNGFKLNPTEDRDGVLLHSKDGVDAIQNREIIESAYNAATVFTSWLITQGAKNLFIPAFSRFPDEKWSETSKSWIEENIQIYREFIFNSKVVETAEEGLIIKLSESIIPNYGTSHESKLQFYNLVKFLKGADHVPAENLILDWIDFVGPTSEEDLWPEKIYYGLEDLMQELSDLGSLESVWESEAIKKNSEKSITRRKSTIDWINNLIDFLVDQKESELLNDYAIIPNHNQNFLLLNDLFIEDIKDPIDGEFLDLIESLDKDWRDDIIHSLVNINGISVNKIGLSDISEKVNEILKERILLSNNRSKWKFKDREDKLERLIEILRIEGKDSKDDSFKNQIFSFGKEIFGFDDELEQVDHIETFRFENALRLFIELINSKIEEMENLTALSDHLMIPLSDTKIWINDYLNLLHGKSDFEHLLKFGWVIPDRYGSFKLYEDLRNYGTVDIPLDENLLKILFELDENEDWKLELVHECISFSMAETTKFEELGNKIQEIAFQLQKDDLSEPTMGHLEKYRNCLLDLINWANYDERAEKYLKSFKDNSNELFFKLTMRDSNFSVDDIKMLSDPESKALLHKIHNSSLSKKDIENLISRAEILGSVSALLDYADDLVREKQSMEWLLKVGTEVEKAFLDALSNESLKGDLNHIGSGSFDFSIINPTNGKTFYIELKSFANGSQRPFRFAPSQAQKAMNSNSDFAICLIERPNHDSINSEYIKANTKAIIDSSNFFKTGYDDYLSYKKIMDRNDNYNSKLRLVLLEKERIEVPKHTLIQNSMGFNSIIEIIKRKIS